MADPVLVVPTVPTFYFIGVTTGQSSSRQIFPLWMEAIGRPEVQLVGIDLPLHAEPAAYRRVVMHIKQQPLALGALVTTHKIDLLAAAQDLFDELNTDARLTGEVSSIAKDRGRLVGRATDPIAGGLSLDAILGSNYFARTGGDVLMLGAGGAGTALTLHLLQKSDAGDRPARLVVVDRTAERLQRLRQLTNSFSPEMQIDYVLNILPAHNDAILSSLSPGSLVINATGMGKDTPGSPLSAQALFPQRGMVWELNYRGALDFLQQAKTQAAERHLTVADGWSYFLHGWTQVIAHVLHVSIDPPLFARLSQIATAIR